LALLDPEDLVPINRFCQMYKRELNFVFDYVTLDVMFRDFKEGEFLHCVSKYINEGIRKKVFLEVESECARG